MDQAGDSDASPRATPARVSVSDPDPDPAPDPDPEWDTSEVESEKHDAHDGHRPCRRDMRRNPSRATSVSLHRSGASSPRLQRASSSRLDLVVSRLRSRATPRFTHPLSHERTTGAELVDFDGPDDPYRPINWPTHRKVSTTLLYGLVTMTATWASSSYSAGTQQIAAQFGVGTQVATLGTTLFLFGFGIGPLLWAPLSEVYGRRIAVLLPMSVAICFSFGSATAKDLQTLMITRFFGAFFASAPVTNTGGVLGDLYSPAWRGIAMAGYAMAVVAGPVVGEYLADPFFMALYYTGFRFPRMISDRRCCLGPIVSAAVVAQPSLGWRWTEYLTGILQAFVLVFAIIFIDETYPPRLLVYKARQLRHDTGNWALHAKFEEWDVSVKELARKFLVRPIQLLLTPICFLIALYASFCYGILYMQLGGIPIIFNEVRKWPPFVATLPFLCILIGAILGCGINVYNQTLYNKAYHSAGNRAVPEKRLPPMMLGSLLFSGGLFLSGWTAEPTIHWIVPCIGLVMLGTGFFTIFQAALNYLVDTFQTYAASAVAANTFLRSCLAGAFPLVVGPMYHNLGVGVGSCITGGFAALLIPVPFAFYIYGKRIRARSKWSRKSVYD